MNNSLLRLYILAALLPLVSCSDNAKDKHIAPGDVPPAAVSALYAQYPGAADVSWEREMDGVDTVYEASFTHDGKTLDAEFDKTGAPAEKD